MVDENSNAVLDADATIIAALLRLAEKKHGKVAVQEELADIHIDLTDDRSYWDPFSKRISQIKQFAGLE